MESVGLQMDDIFGAEEDYNREDIGAEQNAVETNENIDDENTFQANIDPDTAAKLAKGATKKVVRNPQPKLDPQRLAGQRGIAILPKLFENVKFKGKGYEEQDLEKVIKGLEHWAHRLFPKRTFDECLQIIERLGNKREVKTCIKKIRLDMPVLDEDFVSKPEEEVIRGTDNNDQVEINEAESAFDEMMMQTSTSSQFMSPPSNSQIPFNFSPSSQPNSSSKPKTVLSDELKEKIERNRRLALEKRAQKLQNSDISLSILSSQDEEKHSQVTETNLNETTKQCQISTDDNGEAAGVSASDNNESVNSSQKVTSINIPSSESPCDPASPVTATKDSVSASGDEPSLDEKRLMSPICDKSLDMETTESPCDPASPSAKDSISPSGNVPSSGDKKPMSIGKKSLDMETTESPCDPSNIDSVSPSGHLSSSGEKKPMSPICDKSLNMEKSESPCDPASPMPSSGEKKPMSPICDKSLNMETSESPCDPTSPLPSSGEKKPMSPICDKSLNMETSESPCDPASPSTKDSLSPSRGEPFPGEKKPMSPTCDKPLDMETSESPCDPASPMPSSGEKKPMSPICDKSLDMETSESPCDPASPVPSTKDSVSSSVDEPSSSDKKSMSPICDKPSI